MPPLAEQKRIVQIIDFLFEKLNLAQERLKGVLNALALHKIYLLKNAFEGVLTANFRAYSGISKNDWQEKTLGEICKLFTGNSINEKVKQEKYFGKADGLIYIATKDVGFDTKINYDTNIKIPETDGFKIAPANTALLCIEGGSAGKKVGFTNQPVCFVNKLCAFVANGINSKLIFYFLQSQNFMNQFNSKKHGLIGGVSIKNLAEIKIPVPPLVEQKEIARQLDSFISKENFAQDSAEKTLQHIDALKKNILVRAFRGELVNNNLEN